MTFKEIWSSFCDKTKEQGIKAWEGIKQVCSSSFSEKRIAWVNTSQSILISSG